MAHDTLQSFDLSERTSDARLINSVVDIQRAARWWDELLPPGTPKDVAMPHLLEALDEACRAEPQRRAAERAGDPLRDRAERDRKGVGKGKRGPERAYTG